MSTWERRLVSTVTGVLLAAGAASDTAAQSARVAAPRLRIGVLDMNGSAMAMQQTMVPGATTTTVAVPPPMDFARGLTQMLTTALIAQPEFSVVERVLIEKVAQEQDLGASERVELKSAAALGRILGAQALITGDITEFSYGQSSTGSRASVLKSIDSRIGAKVDRLTAQVAIDLRIIDATTGEVIGSVRGEGKASTTGLAVDYTSFEQELAAGGTKSTPLGAASRQAIEKAVVGLVDRLRRVQWFGRVADVREEKIYINAGSSLGVTTGMLFDVFVQGESITDPESGASLGTPDQRIGQLVIEQVAEKYSVGVMREGQAPKRNDVVRFRGAGNAP
jgi:curli biogenesis system outer membrane secretion channel CsgG